MMSLEAIRDLSNQAARKARRARRTPCVFFDAADVENRATQIPNLGSYRPAGWKLVEHKLVDKSGFGAEDEPALTFAGFKRWVCDHVKDIPAPGWGIIEEGQFQVVIGRFVPRR